MPELVVLALALALPAKATTVTAAFPIARGQTILFLACPEGETFTSGTATLYQREGGRVLATVAGTVSAGSAAEAEYVVTDKRTRYVAITQECQPATLLLSDAPTVTLAPGETVTAHCPDGTFIDTTTVQVTDGLTITGYEGARRQ